MSNWIDRGVLRPVATSAIWKPDAIEGLTPFVGVNVVWHAWELDCPNAGDAPKESSASTEYRYTVYMVF